ncbi:MAG: DUF2071 domain-containing protein [Streptosporangiaceae bacterium]
MRQRWERLTFLHWPYDPAQVQRLLPAGLAADELDGAAWVGLVPFFMHVATASGRRAPWRVTPSRAGPSPVQPPGARRRPRQCPPPAPPRRPPPAAPPRASARRSDGRAGKRRRARARCVSHDGFGLRGMRGNLRHLPASPSRRRCQWPHAGAARRMRRAILAAWLTTLHATMRSTTR